MAGTRGISRHRRSLPDSARLGTLELGCFRLKGVLGRGSYGTVFLADQEGFAREAVVKIAHAKLIDGHSGATVRNRFAAELRAATRVKHPNVVTLYTAGETSDGLPAIAMEYVPGASLEDILLRRAGDLPAGFVHDVFAQLGHAVAAFHRAAVIHRDLSPANVVVGDGDDGMLQIKVLDFGVAKMGKDTGRTSVVGTPRYMAPEQVVGASAPASDVYAVGAMLWWTLTGQEFQSEVRTLEDVTEARLMGAKPTDVRDVARDVPAEIAELLKDMLAFEAGDRPTASEFCARWDACFPDRNEDAVVSLKNSVTLPPTQGSGSGGTVRPDQLECVVFETDHVRTGVLQGFLALHRCRIRSVEVHEASRVLATRPDLIFVSGLLPGGASGSLLHRAKQDAPGALLVALISTERQRTTMIRAGADYALRVPADLPHLVEAIEDLRRGGSLEGRTANIEGRMVNIGASTEVPAASGSFTSPSTVRPTSAPAPSASGSYPGAASASGPHPGPASASGVYHGPASASGTYPGPASASGAYPGPASASGAYPGPASSGSYPGPASASGSYPGPASASGSYPGPGPGAYGSAASGVYPNPAAASGTYPNPAAASGTHSHPSSVPPQSQGNASPSAIVIESFMGEAPELIADISEAIDRRQANVARVACDKLRDRARALGGDELVRLSSVCAALADTGDFETAAGFRDELEEAYSLVFRDLMIRLANADREPESFL